DKDTHGKKLYSIFASNKMTYLAAKERKEQPVGQVLVKQSWTAEEVKTAKEDQKVIVTSVQSAHPVRRSGPFQQSDHFLPYAEKDGKTYRADKPAELFIMFKVDAGTENTDKGWVYGTVSADGKKVTSSGKVAACMKCHQDAPHDKLFGLPEKK